MVIGEEKKDEVSEKLKLVRQGKLGYVLHCPDHLENVLQCKVINGLQSAGLTKPRIEMRVSRSRPDEAPHSRYSCNSH